MEIVCENIKEYAYMLRLCMDNWTEDNCKCCVLRSLCGQRKDSFDDDIERILVLKGG